MVDSVDILRTRTGYKPDLVLVVPIPRNNHHNDIDVRRRSTISDEEYRKKLLSPLGSPIDPTLSEVFIPVERRFESALRNFDQLRRRYPIYAEVVHHKLRLSAIDCPNGWYDLLLPIAHDYTLQNSCSENVLEYAMNAWHAWWAEFSSKSGSLSNDCQGLLPAIDSTLNLLATSISASTPTESDSSQAV